MGLDWNYGDGQTALDEEEKEGLKIKTIGTKAQLDAFEQIGIEEAILWSMRLQLSEEAFLTESFIRKVHKKMFEKVWQWAGSFRKTEKNIGIDKWLIPSELKYLLDDTAYWITNSVFSPDEICMRLKHRLVSIHCFANGNGRHSRLVADMMAEKLVQQPIFTWGSLTYTQPDQQRAAYLNALRQADKGNYELLIGFARA
jgi:Fic-DOC domain mobile mystery protein B